MEWAGEKLFSTSGRDAKYIYGAAFMQAFGTQQWWVALPFIIKHFGGTDAQVGLGLAANMGAYAISVLLAGPVLERLNPRSTALWGTRAMIMVMAGMGAIVLLERLGYTLLNPIGLLVLTTGLFGIFSAGFWPPVMGWLALGFEGGKLSRRLSRFSLWWCLGALVSPYPAGLLVEIDFIWPMGAALVFLLFCYLSVGRADNPRNVNEGEGHQDDQSDFRAALTAEDIRFRWMARIALFAATACGGIVRTQLALLMKLNLYFSASTFGSFITFMTLASLIVYVLAGRTPSWHYRVGIFWGSQLLLLASMVLILLTGHRGWLFLAAVMQGLGGAFCYISHLYYGAAGGQRRFARMAVHEFTLSVGFVTGSLLGGYLSDQFGRYAPYWFAGAVVALALMIEAILWFIRPKK